VDPIVSAVLASWSLEPFVLLGLVLVTLVYLRGFHAVARQLPHRFPPWRRGCFLAGVAVLALALVSPLDAFADLLLQVHMAQHWLLMMVAPPLFWLSAPAVPLLRGLPHRWLRDGLGPFLRWRALRNALHRLTQPAVAWPVWALTTLVWHWPAAYEAALRSRAWHDFEHASFLAAALLFWYPVLSPWPERRGRRPVLVLYLALAAVFNTVFSASFAFSTRVFYTAYADAPRPFGIDALTDQNAAGAFMWVAASLVMLGAAVVLVVSLLEPQGARRPLRRAAEARPSRWRAWRARKPWLSRALRRSLQWAMLLLAAAIVADGLLGPQRPSALNLAGVLPWTYWRGLVVVALLVYGNLFCAVCPFTLPRSLAGRWLGRSLPWPAVLRGKWLAVALFALYLWAYEAFALWDSPWWTAWIVVGYFAACFLVDSLFSRGRFCRHVCPIGQFHFVNAGVSPTEVRALDATTCTRCTTHDCLRGNESAPGCPTDLFLPLKSGSSDCTGCLDCVRACPHDNAGVVSIDPGSLLGSGRSPRPERGVGLDGAALVLLFCFGAFANAAAMVAPVAEAERALAASLGTTSFVALSAWLFAALGAAPPLLAGLCAGIGWGLSRAAVSTRELVVHMAPSLVPVGFAMWFAHFGFHLVTGLGTLSPAATRAAADLGLAHAHGADMAMTMGGMGTALSAGTLEALEIAALGVGLVVSAAVAWRLARELVPDPRRALGLALPWALLAAALWVAGVWIFLQPMEMRGMVMG
jgi:cytochrome c oxidase assembly factor CtaG